MLFDDHHGTRCAGQIAAVKNDVCGVGIAYNSKVAGVRIVRPCISPHYLILKRLHSCLVQFPTPMKLRHSIMAIRTRPYIAVAGVLLMMAGQWKVQAISSKRPSLMVSKTDGAEKDLFLYLQAEMERLETTNAISMVIRIRSIRLRWQRLITRASTHIIRKHVQQ